MTGSCVYAIYVSCVCVLSSELYDLLLVCDTILAYCSYSCFFGVKHHANEKLCLYVVRQGARPGEGYDILAAQGSDPALSFCIFNHPKCRLVFSTYTSCRFVFSPTQSVAEYFQTTQNVVSYFSTYTKYRFRFSTYTTQRLLLATISRGLDCTGSRRQSVTE